MKEDGMAKMQTERTAKKWKVMKLIAVLLMILGTISCVKVPEGSSGAAYSTTAGLWFLGVVLAVISRFGAWWFHG